MSEAAERREHQTTPDGVQDWVTATALPGPGGRSADHWEPLGPITLAQGEYEQIAPRRPGRSTLLVVNTGGGVLHLTRRREGNSPARYQTLGAGASLSFDTEAPVFAYAVGATTVEPLETMFAVPELSARNQLAVLTAAAAQAMTQ